MPNLTRRKKNEKRSPFKVKPLRLPGQSLQEEIDRKADKGVEYIVLVILLAVFVLYEWWRWFFSSPPSPFWMTIFAMPVWIYGIWKIFQIKKALTLLKQGRDGEKIIGQSLERLREKGFRVLHDIVGDGFNIDHVLIGPTGVYTVETKAISKPANGRCEVSYDGEKICLNGFPTDRDPIVQAKAQANWLHGFIKDSIQTSVPVRPVVLYPGWYVKPQPKSVDVWVLNPDALPSFIKNERSSLEMRDIQAIEYCLATYCRTFVASK